jgi:hypothetical protein
MLMCDLDDRGGADADLDTGGGAQGLVGDFALFGRQALGIVDQADQGRGQAGSEYHGSRHDRAGQRPAACLVDAGDPADRRLLQCEINHMRAIAERIAGCEAANYGARPHRRRKRAAPGR